LARIKDGVARWEKGKGDESRYWTSCSLFAKEKEEKHQVTRSAGLATSFSLLRFGVDVVEREGKEKRESDAPPPTPKPSSRERRGKKRDLAMLFSGAALRRGGKEKRGRQPFHITDAATGGGERRERQRERGSWLFLSAGKKRIRRIAVHCRANTRGGRKKKRGNQLEKLTVEFDQPPRQIGHGRGEREGGKFCDVLAGGKRVGEKKSRKGSNLVGVERAIGEALRRGKRGGSTVYCEKSALHGGRVSVDDMSCVVRGKEREQKDLD